MQTVSGRKSVFPAVMLGIGAFSLPVALWLQLRGARASFQLAAAALIALYVAWIALEAPVTVASANEAVSRADHRTLQLYGVARLIAMLFALFLPSVWQRLGIWTWLSFGSFAAGVALRWTAIRALGDFYSHQVRTLPGHRIVESGPYQWIRHPAYLGMLLAHAGLVLCFCNVASVAAFVLLFVPAVIARIRVEERTLLSIDGYAEYALWRKRLIPLVW